MEQIYFSDWFVYIFPMKKLIIIMLLAFFNLGAQQVNIIGPKLKYDHGDLVLYADGDTNSFVSVHSVTSEEILKLDDGRSDKWHKEKVNGPYKKQYYSNSGYDLGHLTPSHITSYDDSLNYHSFSLLNQAPQIAAFNRGKWAQLEGDVADSIIKVGKGAIIVTGVVYDNRHKVFLGGSRIKIPISFYKIIILDGRIYCWIGSNVNGLITVTSLDVINGILKRNRNKLRIEVFI